MMQIVGERPDRNDERNGRWGFVVSGSVSLGSDLTIFIHHLVYG